MFLISLLVFLISINFVVSANTPFFRKDYTFLEGPQSFYKLHVVHRNYQEGIKRCMMEGAKYYYPENAAEVTDVIAYWNITQPGFHWVYVGISDLISKGDFETYDGIPIIDIYNNWAHSEPNNNNNEEDCVILHRVGTLNDVPCYHNYPFICKKTLQSLEWNNLCDMPDSRYLFTGDTGKCYKIHLRPATWVEAYSTCYAEQSYLAVVNGIKEADHLGKLITTTDKPNGSEDTFHVGFHNKDGDGWKTIKGLTLADSGYSNWDVEEPGTAKCGAISSNSRLRSIDCDKKSFFICEHDIFPLGSAFDDRLGGNIN